MESSNKSVVVAVLTSAALIAAALIYTGYQYANADDGQISVLIDERLQKAAETGRKMYTDEEINALIDQRMDERKSSGLSAPAFDARIEKGILAFIEKQRRAEQERPNQMAKNVPRPSKSDHVYGNPNAEITLIEYSDFECPYCKQFHVQAKQLVDKSDGKVNWVYRHFPLEFHNPGAQKQAEASECAAEMGGNEAFWKVTNAIYERTKAGGKGFPLENLGPLAAEMGLDRKAFQACVDSGKMAARVKNDFESGAKAGITGTPGNILVHLKSGNVRAMHGAASYEQMQSVVEGFAKQGS